MTAEEIVKELKEIQEIARKGIWIEDYRYLNEVEGQIAKLWTQVEMEGVKE